MATRIAWRCEARDSSEILSTFRSKYAPRQFGGITSRAQHLEHLDLVSYAQRAALQHFPPHPTTQARDQHAPQARLQFVHTLARRRFTPNGKPAGPDLQTPAHRGREIKAFDEHIGAPCIPGQLDAKFGEDLLP